MNIKWETVLIALIQALAAVATAWVQRHCERRGQQKKRARRPASHT